MNARQETAWKNLSFYRGYLPPADRERVKEYLLLSYTPEEASCKRENSQDPSTLVRSATADLISPVLGDSGAANQLGAFRVEGSDGGVPISPQLGATASQTSVTPSSPAAAANKRSTDVSRRFFMIKKADLAQVPHFKSFLFKVKKCLDICQHPAPCTSDCPNVHIALQHPALVELNFEGMETIIVNRGNLLPSVSVKLSDMERTAGALFCCGLVVNNITQAVQGTECRFGDKCRYGNRCLFIHMKKDVNAEPEAIMAPTEAETLIVDVVRFLKSESSFLERLKDLGMETVGDVQFLSNAAFDALVARSPTSEQWLWTQVHSIRELKERGVPLAMALATFPGVPGGATIDALQQYRLQEINQLLELKPKVFYAMKLPPRIVDACERIRQRYEPEREAYSTIDLTRLPPTSFYRIIASAALDFRATHAHASWRKQDATRPIVTSLITYVDSDLCQCQAAGGTLSATQTPALGPMGCIQKSSLGSPQRLSGGPTSTGSSGPGEMQSALYPDNAWCRCARKWELAVNYELSTPSGSRCSEQNCLGKLASMGLATCNIREIFVHGDMHRNEDPNPLFPCGVCENMLRRITHDVQKRHTGDVTLYMFDQVKDPRKLVVIPVQEISHREGSNFKRFIQEDLRDNEDELKCSASLT